MRIRLELNGYISEPIEKEDDKYFTCFWDDDDLITAWGWSLSNLINEAFISIEEYEEL